MVNPALSATSVCGNHRRTRVDTKDVELQQHLENSRQHRKLEMKAGQLLNNQSFRRSKPTPRDQNGINHSLH
eukprot:1062565-Amphidinium_carterae.1